MDTSSWYDETFPELRASPPWMMGECIDASEQLARSGVVAGEAEAIAEQIRQAIADDAPITVVGCGTSLHAAVAVAHLLEHALAETGRVLAADALEAALSPKPGLTIGISHDGATRATTLALAAARAAGGHTSLITHRPSGATASAADVTLRTPIADHSWCHTIAYTSAILAGAAIADRLTGTHPQAPAIGDRVAALLDRVAVSPEAARALAAARVVITTGSGVDRGTARELALKIEEGAHVPSAHRDLEILLHGHLVACGPETPIVLVALDDSGRPRRLERAALLCDAAVPLRIAVVLIADEQAADRLAHHAAVIATLETGRPTLPSPLDAILAGAIALQQLTLGTTHAAGTNPDLIRREQAPWRTAAQLLDNAAW